MAAVAAKPLPVDEPYSKPSAVQPPSSPVRGIVSQAERSPDYRRRKPLQRGSPPSSLATIQTQRLSPTERELVDKKRIKRKLVKRRDHATPGPGTYNPQRLSSTSRELAGSTAFGSKTVRKFEPAKTYGGDHDPGAYEPMMYLSLATKAKATFSESIKSGVVGFGATADRILSFRRSNWNEGEKTPAPTAYDVQVTEVGDESNMSVLKGVETMQMAAFASETQRPGVVLPSSTVPGPGAYDPNFESVEPSAPDVVSKTGRDSNVAGKLVGREATGPSVGPGTYDSDVWLTMAAKASTALEKASQVQISSTPNGLGFGAAYKQRELPFEEFHGVASKAEATPAPTAYSPMVTEKGSEATMSDELGTALSGHGSRFKDTHVPDSISGQYAPHMAHDLTRDPTAYHPYRGNELADHAKHSFQEARIAGKGSFEGLEPRELKLSNVPTHPPKRGYHSDIEDTPAPNAYDVQVTEVGDESNMSVLKGVETMQMAAFASETQRPGVVLPSSTVPGPGAYDPNFESVEPSAPDVVSKTGRDSNVAGKLVGREATGPSVGPGTYDSDVWLTMAAKASTALEKASQVQISSTPNGLGFGARYKQRELPFEEFHGVASKAEATPAPTAYSPMVTEKGSEATMSDELGTALSGHGSRFKDTHVPDSISGQYAPHMAHDLTRDPTAYHPYRGNELADHAKHSFQEARIAGKGSFEGLEPRELKLSNVPTHPPKRGYHSDIEDTPAPNAYDVQVTEVGDESNMSVLKGVETMQMAAFASETQRPGVVLPSSTVPGPGAYDPNFESVEPSAPDLVSKTGRDSNVAGKLVGREATGPSVGPGTYEPELTNDGERNTMASRSEVKSFFGFHGWSASFVSDSIRSVFSGWFPDKPNTVTV